MSGADWSLPTTATTYTSFPGDLSQRLNDALSLFMNAGLGTNIPTGAVRANTIGTTYTSPPTYRLEWYTGSAWKGLSIDQAWNSFNSGSYVSTTSFAVTGDFHLLAVAGLRVRLFDATTLYATVVSSSYNGGTGLTTIIVVTDSGNISASLTEAFWSDIDTLGYSVPQLNVRSMPFLSTPLVVSASTFSGFTAGGFYDCTNAAPTGTLPAASGGGAVAPGYTLAFKYSGTGTLILTAAGSDTIDGLPSITLYPGDAALLYATASGTWRNLLAIFARHKWVPVSRSGTVTLTAAADNGRLQRCTTTMTINLPAVGTGSTQAYAGWETGVINDDATHTITIAAAGSDKIAQTLANITLPSQASGVILTSTGTAGANAWEITAIMAAGALGNAATKAASDGTKSLLASISGTFTVGNLIIAEDTAGTIEDFGSSPYVAAAVGAKLGLF